MVSRAGDTFIFLGHLWVAITTPTGTNGDFIAVNMTSVKNDTPFDDTCIILPGEHSFVKVKTEMYYMKAREWQVSGFDSLTSYGDMCVAHKPVSNALLVRIQQGAISSPHTTEKFLNPVRKELGLPPQGETAT